MTELPHGWECAELSSVVSVMTDGTHTPPPRQDKGAPLLSARDILENGQIGEPSRLATIDYVASELRRTRMAEGDVLLTIVGSIGRSAVVPPNPQFALQRSVAILKPLAVSSKFLAYYLRSPRALGYYDQHARGTAQRGIYLRDLKGLPVVVPPLSEQRQIVAAIEEQLSRLDAAEGSLRAVHAKLQALRHAALSHAMQTNQWPLVPLAAVGDGGRHALAIGPFGSNLKVSDYRDEGVPLVFVRNIRSEQFGGSSARYVSSQKARELASHRIRGGDVLITKMGDPPGDATVYPDSAPEAIITADCIKISVGSSFDPEFVALAIEAPHAHRQVLAATKGVAQKKVSLGRFKQVTIPAPPLEEQRRIVQKLGIVFSAVKSQHAALEQAKGRAATLRHSILTTAFRGELVPQDPSAEPASVLLERIAAERAATPRATRRRNKEKTPT